MLVRSLFAAAQPLALELCLKVGLMSKVEFNVCVVVVIVMHPISIPHLCRTNCAAHSLGLVAWDNMGSPLVCTVINHQRERERDRM